MNASELAVLLPGVAGNLSDEGNIIGFTVRGMPPAMNTITIDGALMGSQGGMARDAHPHDHGLDVRGARSHERPHAGQRSGFARRHGESKSRSTLSMKEKRRITYNFSGRLAPSGTQRDRCARSTASIRCSTSAIRRCSMCSANSAISAFRSTCSDSEQAVGFFSTTRDFQDTVNAPAYVWDYRTQDNYNNRKQSSVNAKIDYRLSPNSKLSLNLIYNDAFERFRLRYLFRAFTVNEAAVPNATTSGVIPGFTSRITQVRPVAASTIDITSQMSH